MLGTLSWACFNEPKVTGDPDWGGYARALVEAGLPPGRPDPAVADQVLLDGRSMPFSNEVAEVLTAARPAGAVYT